MAAVAAASGGLSRSTAPDVDTLFDVGEDDDGDARTERRDNDDAGFFPSPGIFDEDEIPRLSPPVGERKMNVDDELNVFYSADAYFK